MVLPVLSPEMVPPSFARAQLRVKSAPAPATVAKHLVALGAPARLGGSDAALSRWSPETAGDPVDAVSAALAAIAPAVDALDAATVEALRTATFVPVAGGAAMEAPSRLFLRSRTALAPLAYEAPAKLADRASILRTLGAKDDVSPEDAAEVLRAAMRRANGRALGPNEIRAAVAATREAVGDADDEGRRGPRLRQPRRPSVRSPSRTRSAFSRRRRRFCTRGTRPRVCWRAWTRGNCV